MRIELIDPNGSLVAFTEIDEKDLAIIQVSGFVNIIFEGLMIQATTHHCQARITNAVNGYGDNCFEQYKNHTIKIIK